MGLNLKSTILKVTKRVPILNIVAKKIYEYRKAIGHLIKKNKILQMQVDTLVLEVQGVKFLREQELKHSTEVLKELGKLYYEKELLPRVKTYPITYKKKEDFQNILQVSALDIKGGAARIANKIYKGMSTLGYNSKMLVGTKFSDDPNVHEIPRDTSSRQKYLRDSEIATGWEDFNHLSSFKIKDMEVFKESDIVQYHNLHTGYFSLFALAELSSLKPTILTIHDLLSSIGDWRRYLLVNEFERKGEEFPFVDPDNEKLSELEGFLLNTSKEIYKNSNLNIVCTAAWGKKYVEKGVLSGHPTYVVPNGIDEKTYYPLDKKEAKRSLGIPEESKVLLFQSDAGKKNVWKGGEYLEKIIDKIKKEFPEAIFLSIGGEIASKDGNFWEIPYISDEEEMAKYFSAADLFIYPSVADMAPLVVLESQSCGTPVISFRTGGIPDQVEHLQTGYISGHKDIDDFVHGASLFLNDDELRAKASKKARERILKSFTLDQEVANYAKVYSEVMRNN